ncbi:MAG TPA: hypothetical protein DCX34_18405 [Roseovarius sp.]|nr:hypothetical protein [Roseovarius sp.]
MATPAQVANDMIAQARYFKGRDKAIFKACTDAARVIRLHLDGQKVDGRTYGGLHHRLVDMEMSSRASYFAVRSNLTRARITLEQLHREATR